VAIGAAVLGGAVLVAGPVEAVTPGSNGTIMFVANEPCNPQVSVCGGGQMTRAIFEMQPDGSGVRRVLDQNFYVDSPSQAGDGSRILLSVTFGDPEIYKARRTGIPDDSYVTDGCGMSWAPNSTDLTFTSERGCYATLLLQTLPYPAGGVGELAGDIAVVRSGFNYEVVAGHDADDRDPDWSPSGQWIAFASNRSGTYQIWAVRPDGTGLRQVTTDSWEKSFPAFSPDSGRILFTRSRGAESDLWTVKLDGSGLQQVTKTSAFETQASYAPDGSRIVVARQPSRSDQAGSNLYKMRLDGSDVVKLTTVSSSRWAHTDPFWTNVPRR
jgi:TolB protein